MHECHWFALFLQNVVKLMRGLLQCMMRQVCYNPATSTAGSSKVRCRAVGGGREGKYSGKRGCPEKSLSSPSHYCMESVHLAVA